MVKIDELPDFVLIKEMINEYLEIFKQFIQKIARIQTKYGSASLWVENLSHIGELREILTNSSNSEIGEFYRLYMDYVYIFVSAQNMSNIDKLEIEKLGDFLGLEKDDIEKWKTLQGERMKLESDEEGVDEY